MPLSDAQLKALIVAQLGDTPEGKLAAQIDTIWTLYDDLAAWPRLRFLRAKRDGLQLLMGHYREQVTFAVSGDIEVRLSDKIKHLKAMWEQNEVELATEQVGGGMAGVPVSGTLETTAPVAPPTGWPDANDRGYRGDPYLRTGWPR